MQPLGHFYGHEDGPVQANSGAGAAISRKAGLAESAFADTPAIAPASHALYIAVI
jgi:hypothetical protein